MGKGLDWDKNKRQQAAAARFRDESVTRKQLRLLASLGVEAVPATRQEASAIIDQELARARNRITDGVRYPVVREALPGHEPTDKQIALLKRLGVEKMPTTKHSASAAIDRILSSRRSKTT